VRVAGVLLAAGSSRRLGRPKQLARLRGEPLVRRAARALVDAGCAPVFAVTGARARSVETALDGLPVECVLNAAFRDGLASSIRVGVDVVRLATPPCDGVLLSVVDQPAVDAALLRTLIERFEEALGVRAVACAYAGGLGVPALFPRALFRELTALYGDTGAKPLLEARAEEVIAVPFPAGAQDVDTAEDLSRAKR